MGSNYIWHVLVFCIVCTTEIRAEETFSQVSAKNEGRGGKWLSLFNIIQFRNDICNASVTEQGICYTSSQCNAMGGTAGTTCAAGFGVCCSFQASCYGVIDQPVSYFRNENWPEMDSSPDYCTYSIKVTDRDKCQVRLDFVNFQMGGPSVTARPFGQCSGDRMAIFATTPQLGLSEGNLLCGNMAGQHIYLPADASKGEDVIRLFAMVGTSLMTSNSLATLRANYTWNIKITQIDCSGDDEMKAPDGCLQYYMETVGTIESFNYGDPTTPYPILLDYAICIRNQQGFCGFTLNTRTFGDSFMLNTNSLNFEQGVSDDCYDITGTDPTLNNDYIELLGGYTYDNVTRYPAAQHCGIFDGTTNVFPGAASYFRGPLIIRFKSDGTLKSPGGGIATTSQQAQGLLAMGVERGFRLTYALASSCPTNL